MKRMGKKITTLYSCISRNSWNTCCFISSSDVNFALQFALVCCPVCQDEPCQVFILLFYFISVLFFSPCISEVKGLKGSVWKLEVMPPNPPRAANILRRQSGDTYAGKHKQPHNTIRVQK